MQLREYQKKIIKGIQKTLKSENKVILAGSTGSGKTEMVIDIIRKNVRDNVCCS